MDIKMNIENITRSVVVLIVGLPLTLSLSNLASVTSNIAERAGSTPTSSVTDQLKSDLGEACVRYMLAEADSKLERETKNQIEEIVGGPVNHTQTCKWAL